MSNCPICNREIKSKDLWWCRGCVNSCGNYGGNRAEWAANRAREFERDRAKVLVEALELELETLGANAMKAMEFKDDEIERLKAQTKELEEVNKSANSVIVKLSNQFLESQERLRRTAQILIEEVGADGPKDAEEAAEKAVGRLRAKPTAEQEREAIVEWLNAQAKTYNFSDQRSLVKDLAYRIKNGEFGLIDGEIK